MIYPAPFVFCCLKRFADDLDTVIAARGHDNGTEVITTRHSEQTTAVLKTISEQCESIADIVEAAERLLSGDYSETVFLKSVSDILDAVIENLKK